MALQRLLTVSAAVGKQQRSKTWKLGYKAAVMLKSRQSCPYNGPELRTEWLAGYDARTNCGKPKATL